MIWIVTSIELTGQTVNAEFASFDEAAKYIYELCEWWQETATVYCKRVAS